MSFVAEVLVNVSFSPVSFVVARCLGIARYALFVSPAATKWTIPVTHRSSIKLPFTASFRKFPQQLVEINIRVFTAVVSCHVLCTYLCCTTHETPEKTPDQETLEPRLTPFFFSLHVGHFVILT